MMISTTLPADAVALLLAASRTPIPGDDPLARRRAIDAAIERIQRKYPKYFKEQPNEIN